jgi:hypothetical protein
LAARSGRAPARAPRADSLRAAGALVVVHSDHFAPNCDDVDWIPVVAARGWAILTKDKAIRRTDLEVAALRQSGAAAFFLSSGQYGWGDDGGGASARGASSGSRLLERVIRTVSRDVTPDSAGEPSPRPVDRV